MLGDIILLHASGMDDGQRRVEVIDVTGYGELAKQRVATKIADWIEQGSLPVDNWDEFVSISPLSGKHPTIAFILEVKEELEQYPLDI